MSNTSNLHINNHKTPIVDYILVLFIVLWSGGGFTYGLFTNWQLMMYILVMPIFLIRKKKISLNDLKFPFLLLFILFLQIIVFKGTPYSTLVALGIFCIFLITKIIKNNFYYIFLRIMTFFAITSLVLWFIDVSPLGHSFLLSISDKVPQLGWDNIKEIENNSAYNSNTIYLYRVDYSFESLPINAGPFWEHGRFAFFLIIALFFSVINENKFLSLRNLILLCALITTFSTAGYVAMVTMAVCLLLIKNGVSWRTVFLSSIAYYIILYISQLDFMTEKIQDNALALDDTQSRFGAIAYHFLQISKSPWIGYGQFLHKVYGDLEISPNGWTDLMRYWGVPMALYMFYIIFKSAKSFMPSNEHNFAIGLTFFIIMMSVSFPQTIMTSPFFYFIYFMAFEGGENRIFYSKKQIKQ